MNLPFWLKDLRFFQIFILGAVSGMPFSILYTSLIAWMKDYEIDLAVITTFAIARLPYSIKVFWSPVIDSIKLPFLIKFGQRKSWMILSTSVIAISLILISRLNPSESISYIKYLAIILGFCAATYDLAYDALRINLLSDTKQAMGSATAVLGWRLGAYITGGLVLFSVGQNIENWNNAFFILGIIFACAALFIMMVKEENIPSNNKAESFIQKFQKFAIEPFRDILSRKGIFIVLASIVCYKMGEAMLGFVSMPFFKELGYTNKQIGIVVKSYGVMATALGSIVGGSLIYRIGNVKGMIICGVLQALSNLMYLWLHYQDVGNTPLLISVSIDNFTGGMGTTALIGYLSALCNKNYSASQYALLSSLSTFVNNSLSSQSGALIQSIGWDNFFILTVILEFPALFLLLYIGRNKIKTSV